MAGKRRASFDASQSPARTRKAYKVSEPELPPRSFIDSDGMLHETLENGVRLRDGILSMESIPEHLIKVTQANAINSPLLRLPIELRKRIWRYVVGGKDIDAFESIRSDQVHVVPSGCKQREIILEDGRSSLDWNLFEYWDLKRYANLNSSPDPFAFNLPNLCRQTYSETITLFYSTNNFYFNGTLWHMFAYEFADFTLRLSQFPALCRSITHITIVDINFYKDEMKTSFTNEFPSLKRLELQLSTDWLSLKGMLLTQGLESKQVRQNYQKHLNDYHESIVDCIREHEGLRGNDLEIILIELQDEQHRPTADRIPKHEGLQA